MGEIAHRDRQSALHKLDNEIRGIQRMVDYERAVLDQVNDLSTNQMNGPMMIALNELKRRISADREYI